MSGLAEVVAGEQPARLVVVDLADVVGQQQPHHTLACQRWIERWAFLRPEPHDVRAGAARWLLDLSRQSSPDDAPPAALERALGAWRVAGVDFVLLAS